MTFTHTYRLTVTDSAPWIVAHLSGDTVTEAVDIGICTLSYATAVFNGYIRDWPKTGRIVVLEQAPIGTEAWQPVPGQ